MCAARSALMQRKRREESRLKLLKDSFVKADKDGDGELSPAEWMNVMKEAGTPMTREEVDRLFLEKDRDLDGKLSFDEFCGEETKLEKSFKAFDKDGDGYITKAEFRKVCSNLTPEQIEVTFAKFDKQGDGKLNYREFCGMMNARKLKEAAAANTAAAATSKP